jgi:hypothetical protein
MRIVLGVPKNNSSTKVIRGQIQLGNTGADGTDAAGTWYTHKCYLTVVLRCIQWNLDSSFSSGVMKKNDGCGKTIDAGPI